MKLAYILTAAAILTGCAGSPVHTTSMTPAELQIQSPETLCNAYSQIKNINVRSELIRRNAVPEAEWTLIDASRVTVGMSAVGARCSWGWPTTINTSTTAGGSRQQWVYRPLCPSGVPCKTSYLYVEGGKVTGIQN